MDGIGTSVALSYFTQRELAARRGDGRMLGLIRVWNYFPGINEVDGGRERYRRFSVGHETMHAGDAREQAAETVGNVLAVIEQARGAGIAVADGGAYLQLKAYVRHPEYLPAIHERLTQAFGAGANVVYLQADICRSELLMEVEGVCFSKNNTAK